MKQASECRIAYYSDVTAKTVEWLWYPYIPYGKITIVQGDPGEGKTSFALQLAATLSRGFPLPDGSICEPMNILYQSAEDSAADTIKPRLELFGADCNRVAFVQDDEARLSLTDNRLVEAIHKTRARLLILDPLQAFIPNNCDMGRAHDMREAMGRLAATAAATNCAVLIIGHMTKSSMTKGLYRGIGSIDIAAIARSILLIGRPESDSAFRVLVHVKSNLAPYGASMSFSFDEHGRFQWETSNVEYSMQDLLGVSDSAPTSVTLAEDILNDILDKDAVPTLSVYEMCKENGLSKRTIDRAKKNLAIQSIRKGDKWYWKLPNRKTFE